MKVRKFLEEHFQIILIAGFIAIAVVKAEKL